MLHLQRLVHESDIYAQELALELAQIEHTEEQKIQLQLDLTRQLTKKR